MSDASATAATDATPTRGYLRDTVYGAIDGAVTTFAIVAGVAGAGLSVKVIIALGLANVLADGFSMAAGNYSGTKAELDDLRRLRDLEQRRYDAAPGEGRGDLRAILRRKGLAGAVLDDATAAIAKDRSATTEILLVDKHGLSPAEPHPMRAALATFGAFLLAGMVPLLPFVLGLDGAFRLSVWFTLATFFAIGALKSRWSLAPWWRSGVETLAIGGLAAGIAYVVGSMFDT